MSEPNTSMTIYLTGLRNQHAVETQAIGTVKNQLSRMKDYPELRQLMELERTQSTEQAARLDKLLANYGTSAALTKEAVTGAVATVAGFAHALASDEVIKDLLAAVGYKAYEIGSYNVLVTLARIVGAEGDIAVLETSMHEEMAMGDALGALLPKLVHDYVRMSAAG